jgi:hypothetical protein
MSALVCKQQRKILRVKRKKKNRKKLIYLDLLIRCKMRENKNRGRSMNPKNLNQLRRRKLLARKAKEQKVRKSPNLNLNPSHNSTIIKSLIFAVKKAYPCCKWTKQKSPDSNST